MIRLDEFKASLKTLIIAQILAHMSFLKSRAAIHDSQVINANRT